MTVKVPDEKTLEFRRVKYAMTQLTRWSDNHVQELCQVVFPYMTRHYRKSVELEEEREKLEARCAALEKRIDAYASICKRQDAEIARLHIAYSVSKEGKE